MTIFTLNTENEGNIHHQGVQGMEAVLPDQKKHKIKRRIRKRDSLEVYGSIL